MFVFSCILYDTVYVAVRVNWWSRIYYISPFTIDRTYGRHLNKQKDSSNLDCIPRTAVLPMTGGGEGGLPPPTLVREV